MSNHLSCLRSCGLVVATWQGRQTRYELADPHLTRALHELVDVILAVEPGPDCAPASAKSEITGPISTQAAL